MQSLPSNLVWTRMLRSRDIDDSAAHDVVPLSELSTDEAVVLLIDLGCRADLRDKPERAVDDIDGLFLEEIDSVDTLLELERVIQPNAVRRTHMKRVLRLLNAMKTNGLSRDKLARIREAKHDASSSISKPNALKKKKITEEQALQLKTNLAHTSHMVRMHAINTLNDLLQSHDRNNVVMTNAGMVQSLVCLLREEDLDMRQLVIDVIRRITDLPEKYQIEESQETLDEIISLLEDPSHIIKAKAVETMNFLCRNEYNLFMVKESIGPLVSLLRDADMEMRKLALAALESICGDYDNAAFAGSMGAIEPLLSFLKDADPMVRKNASKSLMYISICDENAIGMVKARAIEPLIQLLKDPSTEVRENAVQSLAYLSSFAICVMFLAAVGAIVPLVSLLGDANARMRANAASALGHISEEETIRILLFATNAIPPLVALLGDEDSHVRLNAKIALCSIIKTDPDSTDLFVAEGGIRLMLMSLVRDSKLGYHTRQATDTLWNIVRSGKGAILEAALVAIEPLVSLLKYDDTDVRKNIAGVIGEIATVPTSQLRLVTAGAIMPLLVLLKDEDAGVRVNTVTALANIMNNNDAIISLVTGVGGIKLLVALLEDKDADVLRRTTETLWNITRSSSNKTTILEDAAVAIEPLVSLLRNEDTEVRRNTVGALAKMSIIRANQNRLVTAGAVLPLLVLLKDVDAGVRENAVIALGNIANNKDANNTLLTSVMAWDSLESLLQDANAEVRQQAIVTISAIEKARTI